MFTFLKNRGRNALGSSRKSSRSPRRFTFEGLEQRQMLSAASVVNGVLMVTGDDGPNDTIGVAYSYDGSQAVVSVADRDTGVVKYNNSFPIVSFNGVEVQALGGNDEVNYSLLKMSRLYGGAGNDDIYGSYEVDWIYGGTGYDKLFGSGGHDYLFGGDDDDELSGGLGIDTLDGGQGSDSLRGGSGNDNLIGYTGNDTYYFSGYYAGFDKIYEYAGQGTDTLDFADLSSGLDTPGGLDLGSTAIQNVATWYGYSSLDLRLSDGAAIENVVGTNYRDVIFGNNVANRLQGGAGHDAMSGYGGSDTLDGGTGNDWLSGSGGHDSYVFGADAGGYDVVYDSLDEYAGSGTDTLDFSSFGQAVTVDLSAVGETQVVAANLSLLLAENSPIENVIGSNFSDTITGNGGANMLDGRGGNDVLHGLDGNDTLIGGIGHDTLRGGDDVDHLHGGAGDDDLAGGEDFDWYYFAGQASLGHDTIAESSSNNGLTFGSFGYGTALDLARNDKQVVAQNLSLTLKDPGSMTNVVGSAHTDIIFGNSKANWIEGQGGSDHIWGRGGDDHLWGDNGYTPLIGARGQDFLYGESGNDELNGGDDNYADVLVGGSGYDKFWAEWEYSPVHPKLTAKWNRDKPADFNGSQDTILG